MGLNGRKRRYDDTTDEKWYSEAIVVQPDQKQISAGMAYPRGRDTPKLTSPPAPCKSISTSGARQNTRPIRPKTDADFGILGRPSSASLSTGRYVRQPNV